MVGAAAAVGSTKTAIFSTAEDIQNKLSPKVNGRRGVALGSARFEDWSIQKGSFFTLDSGQIVELVDVRRFPDYKGRPANLRPAAFLAEFEVKRGDLPGEERIYRLGHSEGGEFALLLNISASGNGKRMNAVLG
jgi:hypothetical protein